MRDPNSVQLIVMKITTKIYELGIGDAAGKVLEAWSVFPLPLDNLETLIFHDDDIPAADAAGPSVGGPTFYRCLVLLHLASLGCELLGFRFIRGGLFVED
jgi:hypothetical protein